MVISMLMEAMDYKQCKFWILFGCLVILFSLTHSSLNSHSFSALGSHYFRSLGGGGAGSGGAVSFSACTLTAGSSAKIEAKGGTGGQARNDGKIPPNVICYAFA